VDEVADGPLLQPPLRRAGAVVAALLPDSTRSDLAGVCTETLGAVVPYALVTQVRER
jgi:hypothetical protein